MQKQYCLACGSELKNYNCLICIECFCFDDKAFQNKSDKISANKMNFQYTILKPLNVNLE